MSYDHLRGAIRAVMTWLRRLWGRLRGEQPPVPTPAAPLPPDTDDDPRLDPAERVLPREVQVAAEEAINDSFGLPEAWRCPCGGRPFVTESRCPRCGRKQAERWS